MRSHMPSQTRLCAPRADHRHPLPIARYWYAVAKSPYHAAQRCSRPTTYKLGLVRHSSVRCWVASHGNGRRIRRRDCQVAGVGDRQPSKHTTAHCIFQESSMIPMEHAGSARQMCIHISHSHLLTVDVKSAALTRKVACDRCSFFLSNGLRS